MAGTKGKTQAPHEPGGSGAGARVLELPLVSGLLRGLLPPGTEGVEATADDAEADLWPGEEALVGKAVPKRRREVAAGRASARRALALLGVPPVSLPSDGDRVPRWPKEVRGSITHTQGYVAAAVAWADQFCGLGIDAERVSRVREDILRLIAKPDELRWVAGQPVETRGMARALLFSAKEAAYKCQFPDTRQRFDFLEAACEVVGGEIDGRGRFCVCFDRVRGGAPPPPIAGVYAFAGDLVLTVAHWPTRKQDQR
jgi:4'-phosphopantetheinyl transferase EntD